MRSLAIVVLFLFASMDLPANELKPVVECYHSCLVNMPKASPKTCREAQDQAWYHRACLSSCGDIAEVATGHRAPAQDMLGWQLMQRLYRRATKPLLDSGLWDSDYREVPDPGTEEWDAACAVYEQTGHLDVEGPPPSERVPDPDPDFPGRAVLSTWDHGIYILPGGESSVAFGVEARAPFGGRAQVVHYRDFENLRLNRRELTSRKTYEGVYYARVSKSRRYERILFADETHSLRADVKVVLDPHGSSYVRIENVRVSGGRAIPQLTLPITHFDVGAIQAQSRDLPLAVLGAVYGKGHEVVVGYLSSVHPDYSGTYSNPTVVGTFAAWHPSN